MKEEGRNESKLISEEPTPKNPTHSHEITNPQEQSPNNLITS